MQDRLHQDVYAGREAGPSSGTFSSRKAPCLPQIDRHRCLAWAGVATMLSPSEVRILHALFDATSRVVGRTELAALADTDPRRGLDAHMYRLRMKLRDMPGLTLETIPKRGFRLTIAAPE
jgi:DNA-binding winged helix-turn-helix (wHTH) protein